MFVRATNQAFSTGRLQQYLSMYCGKEISDNAQITKDSVYWKSQLIARFKWISGGAYAVFDFCGENADQYREAQNKATNQSQ